MSLPKSPVISISEIIAKTICVFVLHKLLIWLNEDCLMSKLKLLQQLSTNYAISNKNKIILPSNWLIATVNICNTFDISKSVDDMLPCKKLITESNKFTV